MPGLAALDWPSLGGVARAACCLLGSASGSVPLPAACAVLLALGVDSTEPRALLWARAAARVASSSPLAPLADAAVAEALEPAEATAPAAVLLSCEGLHALLFIATRAQTPERIVGMAARRRRRRQGEEGLPLTFVRPRAPVLPKQTLRDAFMAMCLGGATSKEVGGGTGQQLPAASLRRLAGR